MKVISLDQGGSAWLEWRQSGVGSSDASIIAGMLPEGWDGCDRASLLQVKLGLSDGPQLTDDMLRGKRMEGRARQVYELLTGTRMTPVCCIHDSIPWLRASLDGLSDGQDLILEIKCPGPGVYKKILETGKHPEYYYPQMQHQMMVTGIDRVHFWAFTDDPEVPLNQRFFLEEVKADREYQKWLFDRERQFVDIMNDPVRAADFLGVSL